MRLGFSCGVVALLIPALVHASPFRWAGNTKSGLTFVDMATVKRVGSEVDYSTLFLPRATDAVPQLATTFIRGHEHVDCTRRTYISGEVVVFKMTGQQIFQKDATPLGEKPIIPGSEAAAVADFICSGTTQLSSTEMTGSEVEVATNVRLQMPHMADVH